MSHSERLEDVIKKMGSTADSVKQDEMDSLEYFYQVRRSNIERVKNVLRYDFAKSEVVHKNGLIIVPITDLHLGSKQCNIPFFKAFANYIMETPNCYTILNGDLAETATKVSVGKAMFEEEFNLPDQLILLQNLLKPLAKAGKILGIGPGNHEERVANMVGINPMEILAERLDVPYFGYQGFFSFQVGEVNYTMVVHHGAGGGGTTGSKANASERMNKVCANADVYFSGHTHWKGYHPDKIFMFNEEGNMTAKVRHYVVGGSFVEYWEAYPEMKGLSPSVTGLTRIEFRPEVRDVRVTV